MIWKYKNVQGGTYERRTRYEESRRDDKERYFKKNEGPSDEVKDLNKEFRDVANRLSVAFKINNEFLFLGDLEKYELRRVLNKLDDYNNYIILLNPHHGTHWQKNMNKLSVDYSISSIGNKLISFFDRRFKRISKTTLSTYCNGDICLQTSYRPASYKLGLMPADYKRAMVWW